MIEWVTVNEKLFINYINMHLRQPRVGIHDVGWIEKHHGLALLAS